MSIATRLTSTVFSRVFRASKDVTRDLAPQLNAAVRSVSKIGVKRVKEFIAAVPIFILFVRELLRQRDQVESQKQLIIIGAAAALSTLGLVLLGGLLSSLPVQLLLLFTHPWVGVPLLVSGWSVIASIMLVIVWLIIYVLNLVLKDDPAYQRIRDQFLPPSAQEILSELQAEIESGGASLDALRAVVEEKLKVRGSKADANKLEKELQRLEKRFRSRAHVKLADAAEQSESEKIVHKNA
ncbi:MAG: hypothetical protein A2V79_10650 [Betaproteobacteria bacterium RBG_16_56_24]|nr:MAG: hypothetical protein A2V79_10650 [Betaproteobacteria bacterium RBG_16_56_24]